MSIKMFLAFVLVVSSAYAMVACTGINSQPETTTPARASVSSGGSNGANASASNRGNADCGSSTDPVVLARCLEQARQAAERAATERVDIVRVLTGLNALCDPPTEATRVACAEAERRVQANPAIAAAVTARTAALQPRPSASVRQTAAIPLPNVTPPGMIGRGAAITLPNVTPTGTLGGGAAIPLPNVAIGAPIPNPPMGMARPMLAPPRGPLDGVAWTDRSDYERAGASERHVEISYHLCGNTPDCGSDPDPAIEIFVDSRRVCTTTDGMTFTQGILQGRPNQSTCVFVPDGGRQQVLLRVPVSGAGMHRVTIVPYLLSSSTGVLERVGPPRSHTTHTSGTPLFLSGILPDTMPRF